MRLLQEEQLDFSDVLILPEYSEINSRKYVNVIRKYKFKNSKKELQGFPLISANMATGSFAMAKALAKHKCFTALHKHHSSQQLIDFWHTNEYIAQNYIFYTMGLTDNDYQKYKDLKSQYVYPAMFCLDVAHGSMKQFIDFVKRIRNENPESIIMAGNVVTSDGTERLINAGANFVKIGVGSGCLAGDTRILMENGTYKNIKDINIHDKVINKNGQAIEVISVKFSGYKKVKEIKLNSFYKKMLITDDHKLWIGDYSSTKNSIDSGKMIKILDKKTKNDKSKFKWKSLSEYENDFVPLIPKNIQFNIKTSFEIDMTKYIQTKRGFNSEYILNEKIKQNYDLGYIFGTFLGDGTSSIYRNIRKNGNRNICANLNWVFHKTENKIAEKLIKCIKDVFNVNAKIYNKGNKNVILVVCKSNPIARLFLDFGKRTNKKLPEKYFCNDKNYLQGIFDGLLDSDGHYASDGRNSVTNTSEELIEQFCIIHYLLNGYFPSIQIRKPTIGGLENAKIENCHVGYTARTIKHPEWLCTNDYQINRINEINEIEIEIPTYDIEVNCETHSFIANNCIVHNSNCLTRTIAGVGRPQFSTVVECADVAHELGAYCVSDGGITSSGDFNIALAAGSDMNMLGGYLSGTDECEGEIVEHNGKFHKKFYGMSSNTAMETFGKGRESYKASEGRTSLVPLKGSVNPIIEEIQGGTRSMMSYIGINDIENVSRDITLIKVNNRLNKSHEKYTIGN